MDIYNIYNQRIGVGLLQCYGILLLLLSSMFSSCENFIELDPPKNEYVSANVYTNSKDANAAILGIYREMMLGDFANGAQASITSLGGLSADELEDFSQITTRLQFYVNELSSENDIISGNWEKIYKIIYFSNSALRGVTESQGIPNTEQDRFIGEVKFLRAFCYFYLVNIFGDVPLIIDTDYEKNAVASRTISTQIYELIVNDLNEAKELLPNDYNHANGERIRATKGAVTALLARVYLYLEDWANAENQATEVIENPDYSLINDLNGVFLKNSEEAIWQLKELSNYGYTNEGSLFILTSRPTNVTLSGYLFNAFEELDKRKSNWVNSFTDGGEIWYYPYKYKVKQNFDLDNITEYSMVLRLAEQYLIRAEARAQQGNISGSQEDINTIRNRAGLENTTASTQEELLEAILKERQVELFTEWGHRWFDLKRTGSAIATLGQSKLNFSIDDLLWPIPQREINSNPNLTQNNGY